MGNKLNYGDKVVVIPGSSCHESFYGKSATVIRYSDFSEDWVLVEFHHIDPNWAIQNSRKNFPKEYLLSKEIYDSPLYKALQED
jgi:hypothetical protein